MGREWARKRRESVGFTVEQKSVRFAVMAGGSGGFGMADEVWYAVYDAHEDGSWSVVKDGCSESECTENELALGWVVCRFGVLELVDAMNMSP